MKCLVVIFLALCLASVVARADLIPLNTENTGQSATTSGGQTDDNNWTYANFYNVYNVNTTTYSPGSYPGPAVVVYTPYPSEWEQDTVSPPSFWVGPSKNQSNTTNPGGNAPGVYAYQLTFDSTSTVTRTVQVSGEIAADNDYEIALNPSSSYSVSGATIKVAAPGGTAVGQTLSSGNNYGFNTSTTTQQYATLTSFSFDLTIAAATTQNPNVYTTLDFLVLNQDNGEDNPTGLDVTDFEVIAVPEPPSWAIVAAGLGLAALGRSHLRGRQEKFAGPSEDKLHSPLS
jgi:hypothetical protein